MRTQREVTVCACPCECPIVALYSNDFCQHCNVGNHWDPRFNLDWGLTFAAAALTIMAVVLVVWLALSSPV